MAQFEVFQEDVGAPMAPEVAAASGSSSLRVSGRSGGLMGPGGSPQVVGPAKAFGGGGSAAKKFGSLSVGQGLHARDPNFGGGFSNRSALTETPGSNMQAASGSTPGARRAPQSVQRSGGHHDSFDLAQSVDGNKRTASSGRMATTGGKHLSNGGVRRARPADLHQSVYVGPSSAVQKQNNTTYHDQDTFGTSMFASSGMAMSVNSVAGPMTTMMAGLTAATDLTTATATGGAATGRTASSASSSESSSGLTGFTDAAPHTPSSGDDKNRVAALKERWKSRAAAPRPATASSAGTTDEVQRDPGVAPAPGLQTAPSELWWEATLFQLSDEEQVLRSQLAERVLSPQNPGPLWNLLRFDVATLRDSAPSAEAIDAVLGVFFKATGEMDACFKHELAFFYIYLQYAKLLQAMGRDDECHDLFNEIDKHNFLPSADPERLHAQRKLFAARVELALVRNQGDKARKILRQGDKYLKYSSTTLKRQVQAIANRAKHLQKLRSSGALEAPDVVDAGPIESVKTPQRSSDTKRSQRGATPGQSAPSEPAAPAVGPEVGAVGPEVGAVEGNSAAGTGFPAPEQTGPELQPSLPQQSSVGEGITPRPESAPRPQTSDSHQSMGSNGAENTAVPPQAPQSEVVPVIQATFESDGSAANPAPPQQEEQPAQPTARSEPRKKESGREARARRADIAAFADIVGALKPHNRVVNVNGKPYVLLEKVGKGGSSVVFKVMSEDFQIRALKRVSLDDTDEATEDMYLNEIGYLEKLRGTKEIIQLEDFAVENDQLLIVLEFGEIDLDKHMLDHRRAQKEAGSPMDSPFKNGNAVSVRLIWQQMLRAVQAIHDQDIVHRDLKPANFVFVQGNLKLIDFGIAKAIQDGMTHFFTANQMGTLNYISPEALTESDEADAPGNTKQGRASDVWSLGCILYRFVYGQTPYGHIRHQGKKIAAITKGEAIAFPACGDEMAVDTLRQCLQRDPRRRPKIPELLDHKFLHPSH